jgi:hypothetical protein
MSLYKWCEVPMKSEYSSYKGDWILTHQKFLRPGDIVFVSDAEVHKHFKAVSMPYQVPETLKWTIDLEPIEWGK